MLLGYTIYLVRAVVSAMVAIFLLFIRRKYYIHTKYKYAHVGVAVSAILDCLMDIWAAMTLSISIGFGLWFTTFSGQSLASVL